MQGLSSINQDIFDISKNDYHGVPKWSLNSYVAKDEENEIIDFDKLSTTKRLFALKADIDRLGVTFREFYMSSFTNFNRLSREVDFFFSDYASSLMEGKRIYTIFSGGDDLFIVGDYIDIIDFAKLLRSEFVRFSQGKATISMGLVMFKPSTPINFISNMADEAEKRAKIERDSIDIFGISMKFYEFIKIEDDFKEIVKYLKDNKIDTTTFYFRLIELCDMRANIKNNIKNAMWKSKLNYLIRRNIDKEDNDFDIFNKLSILIDDYDKKFKPSIFLELYENRK
jgi:CRISPR-associated protein Csm1